MTPEAGWLQPFDLEVLSATQPVQFAKQLTCANPTQ